MRLKLPLHPSVLYFTPKLIKTIKLEPPQGYKWERGQGASYCVNFRIELHRYRALITVYQV